MHKALQDGGFGYKPDPTYNADSKHPYTLAMQGKFVKYDNCSLGMHSLVTGQHYFAYHSLLKSAEEGNTIAQYLLHVYKEFFPRSDINWGKIAAENGDGMACYSIENYTTGALQGDENCIFALHLNYLKQKNFLLSAKYGLQCTGTFIVISRILKKMIDIDLRVIFLLGKDDNAPENVKNVYKQTCIKVRQAIKTWEIIANVCPDAKGLISRMVWKSRKNPADWGIKYF